MKAVALVASEGSARASEARRALRLDPRTKVLMLVCANVTLLCSVFDAAGFVLKFLGAGIVVARLIAAGRRAAGIGFAAVFAAAALLEQMNERGLLDAETFAASSEPKDLFELVRKEDVDELMAAFPTTRLHYVAADGCALLLRGELDAMEESTFQLYLRYHFATCERADLLGVTSHALDIFRK